ncbi:MAG: NAD(P)-dependent oxidoreductase [Arcicella sp.]|nr:NAD(P)-dependent oxidoreductase [Arcicella sp.]
MIIGDGLIAQSFRPHFDIYEDNVILFASGVSNSKLTLESEYLREKLLLQNALQQNKLLVYFSTCSIFDPTLQDSRYILHKLEMEALISKTGNYLIIRLPNVVGKIGNPNTMFNFFINQIIAGKNIQVAKNATRYIIDADDVAFWTMELIKNNFHNHIINVAFPNKLHVISIINIIEDFLNMKANVSMVEGGNEYEVDLSIFTDFIYKKMPHFSLNPHYVKSIIEKYYSTILI